jgi:manganese transport protein
MLPSLLVLAFASNVSQTLIWSRVVLSSVSRFAPVPPLASAADRQLLGAAVNRRVTSVSLAAVMVLITALNALVICQALGGPG